jgi:amino acid adenylation domain-containing protein
VTKRIPLSNSQERLWVLNQLHPGNPAQNLAYGLRVADHIDGRELQSALDHMVQRYEILRTEFQAVNGSPVQVVLSSAHVTVNAVDLRHLPPQERETNLVRLSQQEASDPFDLSHGPLLRATIFRLSDAEYVFLLVIHRIICDQASVELLVREVYSRFERKIGQQAPQVAEAPLQYREIARAQDAAPSSLSYWKQQLESAPATIDLHTDKQRPPVQAFRGDEQKMWIEPPLLQRLGDLSKDSGTSLFEILLASLSVLLSRYSRQEDLVIGTRVSGRERPELENVVGPLENLLAVRTDTSGDPTFAELLIRVRGAVEGARSHQIPFESVLRELRLEPDLSRHPLFQIICAMKEAASPSSGTGMTPFEVHSPGQRFDLSLEFAEEENKLSARFSYNPDLFDTSTITRMMEHFRILLQSAAKDPGIQISRMPLLSEAERHQILVEWNDTRVTYPRNVPLHKLIEEQVEKTPDSVALIYESERITYRQLNERANQLARYLQKRGIGPGVLVGVCAERSLELVIALLSSLKASGAYVPLDPEYPKDRLETMLGDANSPVILTQSYLLDRLPVGAKGAFCLDRDWPTLESESTENLPSAPDGKSLAYVIYTSGSTGKPKGVPNVHEGIVNRLLWMQDMYKLTGEDRVLQKTPFSFDVSVWEFFWPLLTGATLVVARPGGHRDPAYLVNLIAEHRITTLHFVPSMLSIFLESTGLERCHSVRQVFASGEALPFELQQRFFERLGAELHNLYGPTEAAVDVTYWHCSRNSQRSIVPIGRPIANTQIYILDPGLQPVPIGIPGELHIGGIGLARGYLNRPDLTAEKFIPNSFSEIPGARLYKTGDLARFLADGNIEYLGRTDFQVKLRGLRIELGEIEAVLAEHAGVLQSVVVVREDNPGDKRLVAYLIAAPGKELQVESLRADLKKRLPEYMLPSRFVVLEKFPMTTSGKVDRKALPAPPVDREKGSTIVLPRNQVESRLADLFASVLRLPSVGVTDNFFDLGGHSLLAGRLLAQVNESMDRKIPLSALFRGATVESLAQLIEHESELEHDPVVMEIQHGESVNLPFFAIVPPGEESLGYAMLARHMGPQQSVYKIQGHAPVVDGRRPYSSQEMQDITTEYVAAMRTVQPHGPYCLGGLCDGTHIGEQIVLSLEAQGEEVALFAIFDTWVMQHSQIRWLWKVDYYRQRLQRMKGMNLTERLNAYRTVAKNKVDIARGKQSSRTDWQQTYWPEGFTPSRFRAPVILFKRPRQPFFYINDPQMGWGQRSEGGVEIHEIDFDHLQILREPHVRQFGETLAECMARVARRSNHLQASTANQPTSATIPARKVRQRS